MKFAEELQEKYGGDLLTPYEMFAVNPEFNIVTVDKRFQPYAETFGDDFFFAGPQIGQRAGEDDWEGPNNEKKTIYASLGTVFNNQPWFWPIMFEAVKDLDINLICSIGNMVNKNDLGEIPENVTIYEFLPQLKVLQCIDGFVSHAGIGSIMEATWFGVPTVCIPLMGDQFDTAKKVVEMEIGRAIFGHEEITAENLRKEIMDIIENPKYRENLEKIQKDMHKNNGPANAAKAAVNWFESKK
ncbi:nucleotide disphospho-sugar-binding domain-containing protein [uncultured Methanobrevibacter sp.]|uniref:nucleotide disphospho-sugar-binding domain-containing protein n=1 Tax=uncultured Methanobrevibacter sp. TaxID=253161 RepID=UPI0025F3FA09|nr:nucleotide disphospho-sugar-binding domain-containing protein [uncultured Methanobrevibacter sp.]